MNIDDLTPDKLREMHGHHVALKQAERLHPDEQEMLTTLNKIVRELGHSLEDEAKVREN